MSYKTELHCHTRESSACAHETPEYVVERYIEAGYSTLVLTNHINGSTFISDRYKNYLAENGIEDSWDHRIDYYIRDYNRMRTAANGRINVLLGLELRLIKDSLNDYLIYGVTEEWLRSSELMTYVRFKEMSQYIRESGLIIYQAHPFRNGLTIANPQNLDGYEIYNGHPDHDSRNSIAEAWAKLHGLPGISGTDFHDAKQTICAGIITDELITSNEQLLQVLADKNYQLIRYI